MKIRHILLLLTAFLGVALLVAVSIQIQRELLEYQTAQRMVGSNTVREQLLLGTDALAQERSQTFVLLIDQDGRDDGAETLSDIRRRVDGFLQGAEDGLGATRFALSNTEKSINALARTRDEIRSLREQVDAYLSPDQQPPGEFASRWFQESSRIIEGLQSSRLTLLQRERPVEPTLRAEASLRTYASILSESIARNQALMTHVLDGAKKVNNLELSAISRNAGRAELAWEMIDSQMATPLSEPVKAAVTTTHEDYSSTYSPLQQSLLASLSSGVRPRLSGREWYELTGRSLRNIALVQQELLRSSRDRLQVELKEARQSVILWSGLLFLGIAAVIGSALVVRTRVAQPLEQLSQVMLRLADNDLEAPLPRFARTDEIGEMNDALRVFKANAIQREQAQVEKQNLHARLRDAYRQLHRDLEAAAVIQATMLPMPAIIGDVSYRGLYRPSSLIAGDTYNVVRRSDGSLGFFQVDVAGHGAPAALVSVACHHALSQAILTRTQGTPLEEIAAQINEGWPEDLPYFTMILGEIDPRSQRASIVQAGHPSPLVIRSSGAVELVGDGGLPVGMIAPATYERLEFDFGPGDRIFIYSDGLVEAESPQGEAFSDERLRELVRENASDATTDLLANLDNVLRKWRGSETLDDDLSVLMLERLTERTSLHVVH